MELQGTTFLLILATITILPWRLPRRQASQFLWGRVIQPPTISSRDRPSPSCGTLKPPLMSKGKRHRSHQRRRMFLSLLRYLGLERRRRGLHRRPRWYPGHWVDQLPQREQHRLQRQRVSQRRWQSQRGLQSLLRRLPKERRRQSLLQRQLEDERDLNRCLRSRYRRLLHRQTRQQGRKRRRARCR